MAFVFAEPDKPAPAVTVSRSDIRVTEHHIVASLTEQRVEWEALLDGPLSTGESVRVRRAGDTAASAIVSLERVIREQGWEVTG